MKEERHLPVKTHHADLTKNDTAINNRLPKALKYRLERGILLAVLQLCSPGCNSPTASAPTPEQAPPPKVKIAQALGQEVTGWDEYTGRVEAVNSVDIRARVGGYLEKVAFKAGAKINKDDLLFLIDAKPYKAQLKQAKAELERVKAKRDLAKNDLTRASNLFKGKAISAEEYDMRNKNWREAFAAVDSAEANLYTAQLNLSYCEIRAPISGRISREMITVGNLVNGGDTQVLANMVSVDPVYVYVNADEQAILKYRRQAQGSSNLKGTLAELAVADESGFPHQGYIDYISPREDPDTGTLALRGVFANPDELLSPGFFARMRVRGNAVPYQALLVPDRAISTDLAQRFVWVVNKDNHAEYRKIVPGAQIGSLRVISQGLQAEDWVIIEGLQKLKPGIKVNPERTLLDEQQKGAN